MSKKKSKNKPSTKKTFGADDVRLVAHELAQLSMRLTVVANDLDAADARITPLTGNLNNAIEALNFLVGKEFELKADAVTRKKR